MALLQMKRKITTRTSIEQVRERICKLKRKQSQRKSGRIVACGMGQPKDPNGKNNNKKKNNKKPALRKSNRVQRKVEPKAQTKSRKMNNPKSNSETSRKLKNPKITRSTKTKRRGYEGNAE